ncbi:MAG TPA: valine--tRNA ligase [Clostridia bacterium]|nr:valine--tRNA ligase [Clostridia bacterium]
MGGISVPDISMSKTYDPAKVEKRWYEEWEKQKYFHAVPGEGEHFSIVMPPPNVTGQLHMGHALDNTLQDILTRWRRMQGFNTLWLPGTDHAGIATQARVEEQLSIEGTDRYELGREEFLRRVWAWKEKYGGRITTQLRRLGSSCDWDRERFTMDEGCSRAVREVFVGLYERDLIYRDFYITNWCPKCKTTISDIEVEHRDEPGHFYYIKYPVKGENDFITIATTRPETMLGDTAVAVHPSDDRYNKYIGKMVLLPIANREIPVIADPYVDPEFGTGALKITPAHDPNDFEVGHRHNLPQIQVIDKDAYMNKEAGKYKGMDRYECRKRIVQDLDRQGFLIKIEDLEHAVGHCYRCSTSIEPMLSKQWFVRMKPLAEPAIKAAEDGDVRFVPRRFTKIYLNWMENIRDWCISRQLWWGHRIPVWYCQECGEMIVSREDATECPKCGSSDLLRDPDVLDTWFSSALWPFSTLGWPEKTADLEFYYPTSVLVTGRDIIFFWVARMIFSGLEFMDEVPFKDVFIHGLVLDSMGRKMSKSLGNGVDPIEVIDSHGADSLRFMLITGNAPGNDLRFHFERLDGARNFANKIWNASRFTLMNVSDYEEGLFKPEYSLADRWIMSRYQDVIKKATNYMERYELGEAARILYEFIWSEFCDWYIELVKPRLYGKEGGPADRYGAQEVLVTVLKGSLELLHPFMPFITEEIWQHLPHEGKTIMLQKWPLYNEGLCDAEAENNMQVIMETTKAIRQIRSEMNVPLGKTAKVVLVASGEKTKGILSGNIAYIEDLASVESKIYTKLEKRPEQAAHAVTGDVELFVSLKGLIDFDQELSRLNKRLIGIEKDLDLVRKKMNNPNFLEKAPREIVEKEKGKEIELNTKYEALSKRIKTLKSSMK